MTSRLIDAPCTDATTRSLPARDQRGLAAAVLTAVAPQGVLMMPLIIGGFATRLGLSNFETGAMASVALAGCCVAALIQALMYRILSQRGMLLACIVMLSAAYAVLMVRPSYVTALTVLALIGIGMGGLLVLGMTAAAQSGQQTRVTAIGMGIQGVLAGGIALVVSQQRGEAALSLLYILLAVTSLGGLLALPGVPRQAIALRIKHRSAQTGSERMAAPIIVALVAWSLFNFSNGGFWPLIERVAVGHGFDMSDVSRAVSYSSLAGIFGALSVVLLSERVTRLPALIATGAGTILAVGVIAGANSLALFTGAMALFGFLWSFGPPYQLPVVAEADHAGNGMAWAILVMKVSMAIGPAVFGAIADRGGYAIVGALAGIVAAIATGLFLFALHLARGAVTAAAR